MLNILALLILVISSVLYFKEPHSTISRLFIALFVILFSLSGYDIGGWILAVTFFVFIVLLPLAGLIFALPITKDKFSISNAYKPF